MLFSDVALAVLTAAIWGLNFLAIKVGLAEMQPFFFNSLRFLIAALPAVVLLRRGPGAAWRYVIAYGLLLSVASFGALFLGMRLGMGAGLSSLVLQSQALFTLILAGWLLHDRPSNIQLASMAVATVGLVTVAVFRGGHSSAAGFALVVIAAFFWSAGNIVLKKAKPKNALTFLVAGSMVATPVLFLISWFAEGPFSLGTVSALSWRALGALAYVGVLSTLVAFSLWGGLLSRYAPSIVAPFTLLVPIYGMVFSTLLLDERYSAGEWIGGAIVLVGLSVPHVVTLSKRGKARWSQKPQPNR